MFYKDTFIRIALGMLYINVYIYNVNVVHSRVWPYQMQFIEIRIKKFELFRFTPDSYDPSYTGLFPTLQYCN